MATKEIIETFSKTKIQKPPLYRVILLNDDYTPMDFVVEILILYFSKTADEAINIMLKVHNDGRGVCGVYTHEIAQTKVFLVMQEAKRNSFPLRVIMEEIC